MSYYLQVGGSQDSVHPDQEAGPSVRGATAMEPEASSSVEDSHQEEEVKVLLVPYVCMHHLYQGGAQGEAATSTSDDASRGPTVEFLKAPAPISHDEEEAGDSTLLLASQDNQDPRVPCSEAGSSLTVSSAKDTEGASSDSSKNKPWGDMPTYSYASSSCVTPIPTHKSAAALSRIEKMDKEQDALAMKALLPSEPECESQAEN